MMSDYAVGKIFHEMDECVMIWKIPYFTKKLEDPPDTEYKSQVFAYSDRCWYLSIYPNGDSREESKGFIGLYLRLKGEHDRTITYTLSIRNTRGDAEFSHSANYKFDSLLHSDGKIKFCEKSTLRNSSRLLHNDDTLTVVCRLRRYNSSVLGVSLVNRLLNLHKDMKKILAKKECCDLTFKVDGREIKAHRVIVENRSKVFECMLSHDMVERRTGEIAIDDIKPDVFQEVLAYMYSGGEVENLSTENVCDIYVAADKYHLDDLKRLCAAFIGENLSIDLTLEERKIPTKS